MTTLPDQPTSTIDCPNCREAIPLVATAYGSRATCANCEIRWTLIPATEDTWTAEHYAPMRNYTTPNRPSQEGTGA